MIARRSAAVLATTLAGTGLAPCAAAPTAAAPPPAPGRDTVTGC